VKNNEVQVVTQKETIFADKMILATGILREIF
jgi:pyruvate/2-oxoglutarate dehydrogenase complex dihydrolipoamide dehydrogenase (E3) component